MSDLIARFKEEKVGQTSLFIISDGAALSAVFSVGFVAILSFMTWATVLSHEVEKQKANQAQVATEMIHARFNAALGLAEKHRMNTAMPQVKDCIDKKAAEYDRHTPKPLVRADASACLDMFMGPPAA